MSLQLNNVTVRIGHRAILDDATLTLQPGSITAVVGPNGSGKSSLLRAAYRALKPNHGSVLIDGSDIWQSSARAAARSRAVLPQQQSQGLGFTAYEVVSMGRTPFARALSGLDAADRALIDQAFQDAGCTGLAGRDFASLSGGERQRVLLARALCQNAPLLILDEPTNHLDIAAQLDLLALLDGFVSGATGRSVLLALHNLDQALAHADHLLLMHQGKIYDAGPPETVLNPENMRLVFGVAAELTRNRLTGKAGIQCAPLGPAARINPAAQITEACA
ncbi:MAG: ABC transporter ATP-binding protein [Renibacterium sp.]|nr:ABC transporter ATP-binding protein [Renibacterium sp.]